VQPVNDGYQPALDGLRAVAVVVVVLFHGGVSWMSGGYLGVSVFFTLSGFLITRLLLTEHDRQGSVSLSRFFTRRAKRLLPASMLCLLAVLIAGWLGAFPGVTDLRRDVLGALFQVANWVSLASGGSYADILDAAAGVASPVEHYWSLAIEEQFYWLWPLAFVGITAAVARRPGRRSSSIDRRSVVLAITAAACVAAPLIAWVWGPDAAYWATPARAAEILIGASLAAVLAERARRGAPLPAHTAALAPLGLAVVLVCCVVFPATGGPAYAGTLPLFALASAALLLGLQVPGPTARALSVAPVVGLGRISYGVYLYHWPLFVALTEQRTGLDGPALLAVRLAATAVVALASYHLVEQPLRSGVRLTPRPTAALALGATGVVAVAAITPGPIQAADYWRLDQSALEAVAPSPDDGTPLVPLATPSSTTTTSSNTTTTTTTASPATAPAEPATVGTTPATSAPPPVTAAPEATTVGSVPPFDPDLDLPRPVRILVVGDSIAESLGAGMATWALEVPDHVAVSLTATPGCGFLRTGEYRVGDRWTSAPDSCRRLLDERLPEALATLRPDVVVLTATSWDLNERRWDGPVVLPSDVAYARRLVDDYDALTRQILDASDATVVWLRHPLPDPFWLDELTIQEQPAHHRALWDAMDRASSGSPRAGVIDLAEWASISGLDDVVAARPDGIHWSVDAATEIARNFLGPWAVAFALAAPSVT
jgi:peptidoglycan/LPS O-acetylase OafA/YrhL